MRQHQAREVRGLPDPQPLHESAPILPMMGHTKLNRWRRRLTNRINRPQQFKR